MGIEFDEGQDRGSAEQNLWFTVLNLYFTDISNPRITTERIRALVRMAHTDYTRFVCDISGLDYDWFLKRLKTHATECMKKQKSKVLDHEDSRTFDRYSVKYKARERKQ